MGGSKEAHSLVEPRAEPQLTADHACVLRAKGGAQSAISSAVLRQVEQTDLIQYGLIPEFVGRFPVISSLQARPC